MSELAINLISEARENHSKRLDLGNCALYNLPPELLELTWLEELILGSEWYEYDSQIRSWQKKKSKNTEAQNQNKIRYLPIGIKSLSKLKKLNLSGNRINYIEPIKTLTNLDYLDISSSPIRDIKHLKELKNIKTLHINIKHSKSLAPLLQVN